MATIIFPNNPTTPLALLSTSPSSVSTSPIVNPLTDLVNFGSITFSVNSASAPLSNNTTLNNNPTIPPKGGVNPTPSAATAQWSGAPDLRAKIRVPQEYIQGPLTAGPNNILQNNGGILFPYTPTVNIENKASYDTKNPTHSNFGQSFYKSSSVGPINVVGKFTVQNETEGAILLSIIHLLRSLTKMRFGNDPLAGSPPPVCRFDAFGDYMFYNVPVSITNFRHNVENNIDYIAVGRKINTFGNNLVPVFSEIQMDLNIMYSRQDMIDHNVPDWLSGALRGRGFI